MFCRKSAWVIIHLGFLTTEAQNILIFLFSFNPELSTNDGRETLQASETEQYHPHSLSPATIPNIITGAY